MDVLFKNLKEHQKNNKIENKDKEQNNQNIKQENTSSIKETMKIFNIGKVTEEERQKDLLEIPVVKYMGDNEDMEMKDVNEENKKLSKKTKFLKMIMLIQKERLYH